MPVRLEIKLDDDSHSRIHLALTKSGVVTVELLRPQNMVDGHGLVVCGAGALEPRELLTLLAAVPPTVEDAPA